MLGFLFVFVVVCLIVVIFVFLLLLFQVHELNFVFIRKKIELTIKKVIGVVHSSLILSLSPLSWMNILILTTMIYVFCFYLLLI